MMYQMSPTCFDAYFTILRENSYHLLKIVYCNVVKLVTKHKMYHMWVLQRC